MMRNNNRPTDGQLRELYQAAMDFKQAQPWKWLYEADIICVENPVDKTMGYCSVMGKGGQHYALAVYLDIEGVYGFYHLMENADSIPAHHVLQYQDCLMCSFEDRDILASEDRSQIKSLGLSFRGKSAWPMFRRFEPGYHPWFINEEECVFLTHCLRQFLIALNDMLTGQTEVDSEQGKSVIRYSEERAGELRWHSRATTLRIPTLSYSPLVFPDDVLVQRIRQGARSHNSCIQIDISFMMSAVRGEGDERPYYPRICILADKESGQLFGLEMYQSSDNDAQVTLDKLIDICLQQGAPSEVHVRSDLMKAILGDFCKKTGIKLKKLKRLPAIDYAMDELIYRFISEL